MTDYGANNPSTQLKVNVDGKNPDESLSDIPYEKGYAFLQAVENAVGRKNSMPLSPNISTATPSSPSRPKIS
jgi:aminopeptidase N